MRTTIPPRPDVAPYLIRECTGAVRRRLRKLGFLEGVTRGMIAAFVAMCAFAAVDLGIELPSWIRAACGVIAFAVFLAIVVNAVVRFMQECQPMILGRRLDALTGARGEVASGIDLLENPVRATSPTAAGMAELAIDRASKLLLNISNRTAAPSRDLRRAVAILFAVVGLSLAASTFAPRLISTQAARFFDPFGDHPPYSSLLFAVTPTVANVPFGSAFDVQVGTNEPTDRVELVLQTGGREETIPMFPESANSWKSSIAGVTEPGKYFVRSGRARSRLFGIGVITIPRIEAVTFHVTYPAYTRRPPYDGALPPGGLAGLPGTTVEVRAKSNRPLSRGTGIVQQNGTIVATPVPMMPAGDHQVAGTFTIRSPGKLLISVTDITNQDSTDVFTAPIALLADEKPFVRITEPKADSFATPDALMDVVTVAEDDYGLSRMQLFRSQNESAAVTTEISLPDPAPTRFTSTTPLSLSQLHVNPGDLVKLFARTEDNDPAGAKGSESPVVTIRIISQSQLDQMLLKRDGMEALQSKYAEAERRLENLNSEIEKLKKELEKSDSNSPMSEAQRKRMEKLAEEMQQAADEMAKFAGHDLPIDLDIQMRQQLGELESKVRKAGEETRSASTQPSLGVAGALDELKKIQEQLGTSKAEYDQKVTAPLEHLAKILPLIQDQARYLDLYYQQKDLAQRLTSLKEHENADDPAAKTRMRDLEEEQQANREDLRKLMNDVLDHVAALPEDQRLNQLRQTANDFAMAVQSSDADMQMQAAESALGQFAGKEAQANAQAAAETLEKFISKCQATGGQGTFCLKFQPELAAGLGDSVDQLLASMSSGMGGGMSGYSAQRASLANVGLYGNIPLTSAESGRHGGHAKHGIGTNVAGAKDSGTPAPFAAQGALEARGESTAALPAQYKQRVGEYFRRVSDELGE
jgi:hypothetical protein